MDTSSLITVTYAPMAKPSFKATCYFNINFRFNCRTRTQWLCQTWRRHL